ncbi:MAG: L-rhamnose isomerase [Clostridia bacterium]|nr:L-rhamnose isomerase [Clostridia bacterium]
MRTEKAYEIAKELYASIGVDTDRAIEKLKTIPVSIQCWQGDDVCGFENSGPLTGGIQATGSYPGKARNIDELKEDFLFASKLIPGKKKLSLHAIYLDNGGKKIERNEIEPKHFDTWIDYAKENGFGLDFNPTCFSHKMSEDGLTLSHPDKAVRDFWIEHCIASRKIAEHMGRELGIRAVTNHWVPDGFKDIPVDRYAARARLLDSYEKIFAYKGEKENNLDAVESKVFGIGAESCTIGSHEFYMGLASKLGIALTLDTGHYHPTEVVSDKISSLLLFADELLLHVSRPVRWDSDHVVIFDDELKAIASEIIRGGFEKRVNIGLDFFDASINRIAAWTIGARNMEKALLYALVEPSEKLKKLELEGDYTSRLALLEELKSYPFAAVWDMYCKSCNVPERDEWLALVKDHENKVLANR